MEKELEGEIGEEDRKRTVAVWELMDNEVVVTWETLPDAVDRLIAHAKIVGSIENPFNLTLSHPSLYFVFRNGLGETLFSSENSLNTYISTAKTAILETTSRTYELFVPFLVVLLVTSAASVVNLKGIQGKVREISELLGNVPALVWLEQRRMVLERLYSVHNEEMEGEAGQKGRGKEKLVLFNAFLPGFSIIVVFFLVSVCWYLVEYFVLVQDISREMVRWPDIVKAAGSQVTTSLGIWTWMLESFFLLTPLFSITSLPGLTSWSPPSLEFLHNYHTSQSVTLDLFTLQITGELRLSPSNLALLYHQTSIPSPYLHLGFLPGLQIYREEAKILISRPVFPDIYTQIGQLYNCSEGLVSARTQIYDIYNQEIVDMIEGDVRLVLVLVVMHTVVVVIGLGGGVVVVQNRTNRQVKSLWQSLRHLPSEAQSISSSPTRG